MTRFVSWSIVTVLILAAVITAVTSAVVRPLDAPDERHHYSYVQHVAHNPLQFSPRYEEIRTEGQPNHLIHPPLYYHLMAVPYRLVDVERQLTSVGRSLDARSNISAAAMIPVLRSAALLLALVHLVGLWYLIRYLIAGELLRPWAGLVAAATLSLTPAFTLVGGVLNNDVLALALWPFLVLATIRFVRTRSRRDAYLTFLLAGAGILTKATLWLLVTVCVAAVVAAIAMPKTRRELASSLRPTEPRDWALASGAFISTGFAGIHLVTNLIRYGSVQPSYISVYGIPLEESRFYNGAPEDPLGFIEFIGWPTRQLLRSLTGALTHAERIWVANPYRIVQLVVLITLLAAAILAFRIIRGKASSADWIAITAIGTSLLFVTILVLRAYGAYLRLGHFGAQGRYLIGYAGLWVVGVLIAVQGDDQPNAPASWRRAASATMGLFIASAMLWTMARPTFYLSQTLALHDRIGVSELVDKEAQNQGFTRIHVEPVSPNRFVENGRREGGSLPSPRWLMAWSGAKVSGGPVETSDCVEVWLYAHGSTAWGEDSRVNISLTENGETATVEAEVPDRPEVTKATIPAHRFTSPELSVEYVNRLADGPPLLGELWPQGRILELYSVYSRPSSCP